MTMTSEFLAYFSLSARTVAS